MTENRSEPTWSNIAPVAFAFECGLAVLAALLGWLFGFSPMRTVVWNADRWQVNLLAGMWGIIAAVPMVVGLFVLQRAPGRGFRHLMERLENDILPLFRGSARVELVLVCIAAGFAEELLFRGLIQDGITTGLGGVTGAAAGMVASAVIFGLAHAVTRTYALLAACVSVYLSIVFLISGNVVAPMMAHAVYDWVALEYLLYQHRGRGPQTPGDS